MRCIFCLQCVVSTFLQTTFEIILIAGNQMTNMEGSGLNQSCIDALWLRCEATAYRMKIESYRLVKVIATCCLLCNL